MRRILKPLGVAALCLASASAMAAERFPSTLDKVPASWTGPIFQLSQDYPAQAPSERPSFLDIDFRTDPNGYAMAVRDYIYEGNTEVDFQVWRNPVRPWYHAPWLHVGTSGREFIHGMTRERTSRLGELWVDPATGAKSAQAQNWGVGFYNAPGGAVIGAVWADAQDPDPTRSTFPEGTVSGKILFTTASPEDVPYLRGSVERLANIHADISCGKEDAPANACDRSPQTVRLLQMDIAVKDSRSPVGWVFGTFIYNADAPGGSGWERMVPVGISWGNDPQITPQAVAAQATFTEQWMNPTAILPPRDMGCAGRVNGPVDNPISSCLSCHSTATAYKADLPLPRNLSMVPPACDGSPQSQFYFRNIKGDQPFWGEPGMVALDFSLQMQMGIQNFRRQTAKPPAHVVNGRTLPPAAALVPTREQ